MQAVLKNGAPPEQAWLQDLRSGFKAPYLLSVNAKVTPMTVEDMEPLLPYLGVLQPEQFDKFGEWYRRHAMFEDITKVMFASSVEWAFEYIPELSSNVYNMGVKWDKVRNKIYVAQLTVAKAPHIQLKEEHLSAGVAGGSNMFDQLSKLPAEVGVQLVHIRDILAALDVEGLKKRSWTYWSARFFRDAPNSPPLKQ